MNVCDLCQAEEQITDRLVEVKNPDVPDHVRDLSSRFKTMPLCDPCFERIRRGELVIQE